MSPAQDIAIPSNIDTPAKFAGWFDTQLKSVTSDLSEEEAERIRRESLKTITDISLKWDDPATRGEAERDFNNYLRKTKAAIGVSSDFEEARELATNNPGIIAQAGNLVSMLDATKAGLISSLLSTIGFEKLGASLGKLSTLEALVTSFSGNSIFKQIGDALGQADTRITELMPGRAVEQTADQTGNITDMLPTHLKEVFGKLVKLPGAEELDIPGKPKTPYSGR